MSPTILKSDIQNDNKQLSILIETISEWPEWKIRSICIDQSDIELLKKLGILNNT